MGTETFQVHSIWVFYSLFWPGKPLRLPKLLATFFRYTSGYTASFGMSDTNLMKTDNLLFTERPVSIDCKRLKVQNFVPM